MTNWPETRKSWTRLTAAVRDVFEMKVDDLGEWFETIGVRLMMWVSDRRSQRRIADENAAYGAWENIGAPTPVPRTGKLQMDLSGEFNAYDRVRVMMTADGAQMQVSRPANANPQP